MDTATTVKFEVGKTYSARSACNYDCVFEFKVMKRTAKTLWLKYHGEIKRRKISQYDGSELCYPLGTYSMAPVIRAKR